MLLLVAIGLDHHLSPSQKRGAGTFPLEMMTVKNSQVAVICATILFAAFVCAASNSFWFIL